MTTAASVLILLSAIVLAALIVFLSGRLLMRRREEMKPCYRCAAIATAPFMGLDYCIMCRMVVVQMLPVVRHDPPYGFPGAPGYLEFPEEMPKVEGKKEG